MLIIIIIIMINVSTNYIFSYRLAFSIHPDKPINLVVNDFTPNFARDGETVTRGGKTLVSSLTLVNDEVMKLL